MELEGSLPWSQDPATCPHTEPNNSHPYSPVLLSFNFFAPLTLHSQSLSQYGQTPPTTIKWIAVAICYLCPPYLHKTHSPSHAVNLHGLPDLKKEALLSSKTSETTRTTTRLHNPADLKLRVNMLQIYYKNSILCISEWISDQKYVMYLMLIKMSITTQTIYQNTLRQSSPRIVTPFVTNTKLYVKQQTCTIDQKWVQYSDKSLNHIHSEVSVWVQKLLCFHK